MISPDVHASIAAGTYPDSAAEAVNLYERICFGRDHAGEPVRFDRDGRTSGQAVALDVGGHRSTYHSAIRALGPHRVITIEPNRDALLEGVDADVITAADAYNGTLEDWLAEGNRPAQAAFVLNMMPGLAGDRNFLGTLRAATAIGGIVVTSFHEPASAWQFVDAAGSDRSPDSRLYLLGDPVNLRPDRARPLSDRNRYLYLWRHREPGQ